MSTSTFLHRTEGRRSIYWLLRAIVFSAAGITISLSRKHSSHGSNRLCVSSCTLSIPSANEGSQAARGPQGHLWTMDGMPNSVRIANETFSSLGLADRVTTIMGRLLDTLDGAQKMVPTI